MTDATKPEVPTTDTTTPEVPTVVNPIPQIDIRDIVQRVKMQLGEQTFNLLHAQLRIEAMEAALVGSAAPQSQSPAANDVPTHIPAQYRDLYRVSKALNEDKVRAAAEMRKKMEEASAAGEAELQRRLKGETGATEPETPSGEGPAQS